MNDAASDDTPDGQDRIDDFLMRHGGAGQVPTRRETHNSGLAGLSEVHAADGYTLLCEWSASGSSQELKFSEIPPAVKV